MCDALGLIRPNLLRQKR